jgi:hypothetical protein
MTTSQHLALDVSVWCLGITFMLSLAFVIIYGLSRWWEHESGRNLMAFEVVIMLVTGSSLARFFFDEHTWFMWLRTGIFLFVPIILAWRLWMLIRVQYLSLDDQTPGGHRYDAKHEHDKA